jgi:hypothetical protein
LGEVYISQKKGSYAKRKATSIEYCTRYLKKHDPDQLPLFLKHKKQDDLADSYMMNKAAMWQLHFETVYPSMTHDQLITACGLYSVSTNKENGKPFTQKQLLTYMKKNYVWIVT